MGAVHGSWRQLGFAGAVAVSLLTLACGRTAKTDGDNGDESTQAPPRKPAEQAPSCAVAIDGREGRHCAVYQDGSVWCWGFDSAVQPSDFTPTSVPQKVEGLEGAQRVLVGPRHSCALTTGGVLCWGDNESHQIDDSGVASLPPTSPGLGGSQPAPLKGVAVGVQQTCLLDELSHAYCRGRDLAGPFTGTRQVVFPGPPATTMPGPEPYLVDDEGVLYQLNNLEEPLALTEYGEDNAWAGLGLPSCVLKRAGSLWCDNNRIEAPDRTLIAVAALGERVAQAGVGNGFLCALSDGKVWCQGSNEAGQTGTGDASTSSSGHFVESLEDVRAISVNSYSACALIGDGSVWCWGKDQGGLERHQPEQVSSCVNQTAPPSELPRLSTTPPSSTARLAQAGLARAQAICGCAYEAPPDDTCVDAENAAPNATCMAALAASQNGPVTCLAVSLWQEAVCYAEQVCSPKGVIRACEPASDCLAGSLPMLPMLPYCRRNGCLDGQTALQPSQVCDGTTDCPDGSDELNCRDDLSGSFECNPESRIRLTQLCDGTFDCDNSSDERFCQ